jgi:alpha-amylase/alpha-mannosidase (GH57 family)
MVIKACILWEDGVYADGHTWTNEKKREPMENVQRYVQDMLDEYLEKEAAAKRRKKK